MNRQAGEVEDLNVFCDYTSQMVSEETVKAEKK